MDTEYILRESPFGQPSLLPPLAHLLHPPLSLGLEFLSERVRDPPSNRCLLYEDLKFDYGNGGPNHLVPSWLRFVTCIFVRALVLRVLEVPTPFLSLLR